MAPVRGYRVLRGRCVLRERLTLEGSLCPELQSFLEGPFQSCREHMVFHQEKMKSHLLRRVVLKTPVLLVVMMQREGTCACSDREVLQGQLHDSATSCVAALHHKHKNLPPGVLRR